MGFTGTSSILLGIILIITAIVYRFTALLITTIKNSKCTLRETATIIALEEKIVPFRNLKDLKKTKVYTPIYQYMVCGTTYKFKGNTEEFPLKKVGDTEYVFCDPYKPSRIIRQQDIILKIIIGFIVWLLLGLSCVLYGIIINL